MDLGDESVTQPEQSTLNVVEAHLSEVYRHQNYSMLLSVKSIIRINWVHYILPYYSDAKIGHRLQDMLVPMLFDKYDLTNKCNDSSSETYHLLAYKHLLHHSYTILVEFCELSAAGSSKSINVDESVLHDTASGRA